jgi:hypothetical protein
LYKVQIYLPEVEGEVWVSCPGVGREHIIPLPLPVCISFSLIIAFLIYARKIKPFIFLGRSMAL